MIRVCFTKFSKQKFIHPSSQQEWMLLTKISRACSPCEKPGLMKIGHALIHYKVFQTELKGVWKITFSLVSSKLVRYFLIRYLIFPREILGEEDSLVYQKTSYDISIQSKAI